MSVLSNGLFGCLATHRPGEQLGYNGLNSANDSFLKAIIRYSQFTELHLFLMPVEMDAFRNEWQSYFDTFGSDKIIRLISVHQLPEHFSRCQYAVFHSGDPYISDLAALRDYHAERCFPVVGRAHTMSDDLRLSRIRDLVMSPVKSCDAILCSSDAQRQVLKRLLSTASASISNSLGIALPYRGRLERQLLGLDGESGCQDGKEAARASLNLPDDKKIILCLGRLSPFDKMDLHPMLLALNDLIEEWRVDDFLLVIAGSGDAGGAYVQSLLRRASELNIEDHIRLELSLDEDRKYQLYKAADLFVSLADSVQESFGITPLEAMRDEVPVVLSDWNGYRELVENGKSGYLIPTTGVDNDDINRSLTILHAPQARLLESQSVSVDLDSLVSVLASLLRDDGLRRRMGQAGRQHFDERFTWPGLVDAYQEMVLALGKEAASVPFRKGRPAGLSLDHVFGHYPSEQLDASHKLVATDRGLRVVMQSEHGFYFSELEGWLNQELIYRLLEQCIEPKSIEVLEEVNEDLSTRFALAWMLKYQLLQVSDGKPVASSFVKIIQWDEPFDGSRLTFPEQRRARFLRPFLAPGMAVLSKAVSPFNDSSGSLLKSLGDELVSILDNSLLQAVGWFAKEKNISAYSDVLEQLEQSGGVEYLARSYPCWYRSRRALVFRYLRTVRFLLRRVEQDTDLIQRAFGEGSENPIDALADINFFSHHHEYSVFLLTFNYGQKLVYKARDMRLDCALTGTSGSVVSSVNQWLSNVSIGTHQFLCCQEVLKGKTVHYGYVEYLDGSDQGIDLSENEAAQYYRQSGALMAYVLLLGVADLHQHNMISHNGMMYLIDPKTAFHRRCHQRLLNELKQPEIAFLRGLDGSSLEATGFFHVWQGFHMASFNHSPVRLVNGELLDAERQTFKPVLKHLVSIDGVSCLEVNPMDRFFGDVLSGFTEVVTSIVEHADEFREQLSGLAGYQVRYQPFINLGEARKLLCDMHSAYPLQSLGRERIERFVRRSSRRVTITGEVSQRWVEPEWQEAVTVLGDSLADHILALDLPLYVSQVGERSVSVCHSSGVIDPVAENFFNTDVLDNTVEVLQALSDEELRQRFVSAYSNMLQLWLTQQLVPGEGMPEEIRQAVDKLKTNKGLS
ncbi:hypothetical protein GZ77_04265 [Endozoicomonas montiporae]|uniref:Glycosyl transferase family 1 domain-containing protein n=2 Tax=Endozoicomonas montiporae TaxID=1027273 RepID=A0A081NBE7_9GAMM|nr:DUF4135 domain-containing protein [Endozoicomonas montiporae]AMO56047.1 glycosyl transferase family protein [Endozoicomonas montiporae CL-33]KEQ15770.1 hypothetical protein GZ77_04265 [Endozoicomonas montiporae]